jgi:DnaJ-like protein
VAPLLLGAFVLLLLLMLMRGVAFADPKLLIRILRYLGAAALGVFTVLLAVTGRFAPAFFLGSLAWGLATGGHVWPAGWPHFPSAPSSRPKPKPGGSTAVRTPWLEMELDHDTGSMHGTVLKGAHAGKPLDQLGDEALLGFYLEVDDAESGRLLEAYLDRRLDGNWRGDAERRRSASASRSAMSREEAFKVLGLQEGAAEDQIRSAHRRLMMQNHPDRGGSDYIAAKINEAKEVLIGH